MADLNDIFADVPPGIKKFGVVGYPVGHSLSPAMQQAAMDRLHMKAVYREISVKPDAWDEFIPHAQKFGLDGFNVTVPYKEWIRHSGAEFKDPLSVLTGAVNTIKVRGKEWSGYNTDGPGLMEDLAVLDMPLAGRPVVLLGAGGSARAILFQLGTLQADKAPSKISIFNRTLNKARQLKDLFEQAKTSTRIVKFAGAVSTLSTETDVRLALADRDVLLINCTSLGLKRGDPSPVKPEWLKPGLDVYDLIYHRETELMAAAKKAGARKVSGGMGMLVRQGALSFAIWFGQKPPLDVMRKAAEAELERREKMLF